MTGIGGNTHICVFVLFPSFITKANDFICLITEIVYTSVIMSLYVLLNTSADIAILY